MNSDKTAEKINILLVDDRPENLLSLVAILEEPSFNLVKAGSGQEALKHLLNDDFALILLDVQMPIMDGFETAAVIKQRQRSKHIPIIFITAVSADAPFLGRGYDAGAVDYILKPVDPKILRSKVMVFAELHRKTQLLRRQAIALQHQEKIEREREIARLELESLKRAQEANEKYRELVDGITNGIVWIGDPLIRKFQFVSAQFERILADGMRETLEKQIFDHEEVQAAMKKNDFQSIRFEHSLKLSDDKTVWFQSNLKFSKNEHDKIELRGLSVNITDLKNAQEEATKAIRIRDEFLSIASHEMKTPLTPLRLHLESMQRRIENSKDSPEIVLQKIAPGLTKACRQVDRLLNLVEELLDVSKIRGGKFVLEHEQFDMGDVVREVIERLNVEAKKSSVTIHTDISGRIDGTWDRTKIEQVIVNLITNALKYGSGKPIYVTLESNAHFATLSVQDQGIGIDQVDQERIFNLYERAVSPMNFGGLGLGLYIVKQIVKDHGGTIELRSTVGVGSTFIVKLPLTATPYYEQEFMHGLSRQNERSDDVRRLSEGTP